MDLPILDISYKSNLVIYDLLGLASSTQRVSKFYPHWGMYQNSLPSPGYFIVWIHHIVFICSSEDGHLGFFPYWLLWKMLLWTLAFKFLFEGAPG